MVASKGLTRKILLRHTDAERELAEAVQRVYAKDGVEMSLNDTLRHLVRRGGIILACTPGEAWAAISKHCEACEHCDLQANGPGCPEGLYLFRHFKRLREAHQGTEQQNAL